MTYLTHGTALPDPETGAQFYDGVVFKRGLAWLVDATAITALTILAGILTLTIAWFFWPLVALTIGLFYRIGTLARSSATPGMRLMGIELRGHDGDRLDGVQATLHVVGYYASVTFILPLIASVGAILVTSRRQSLTDLV
ncbi:MAG: RDD family protein, partial [Pseudomonadota bacterium]